MFVERISKEAIRDLPLLRFEGPIHVIDDHKGLGQALADLSRAPFIGFDTEKKPTFRKGQYHPTALVQLSTLQQAYLFRVNRIGIPDGLKKILEADSLIKIGVGIRDDLLDMNQLRPFTPQGFVDLNDMAPDLGIQQAGVRNLTAIVLERRISKNQQTSNWENGDLTLAQQQYAATDAWICGAIYEKLLQKGYIE